MLSSILAGVSLATTALLSCYVIMVHRRLHRYERAGGHEQHHEAITGIETKLKQKDDKQRKLEARVQEMNARVEDEHRMTEVKLQELAALNKQEVRVQFESCLSEMAQLTERQGQSFELQLQRTEMAVVQQKEVHLRELKRRTGALAEQHAKAMNDLQEAHSERIRELKRSHTQLETQGLVDC